LLRQDLVAVLKGHRGAVRGVAFPPASPGGCHLASLGEDARVLLWDLASPQPRPLAVRVELPGPLGGLAFSTDGARLAFSTRDDLRLWGRPGGGEQFASAHVSNDRSPRCVAWSPDGKLVAFSRNRAVFLAEVGQKLPWVRAAKAEQDGAVWRVAFSRDGRLATAGADGLVYFWDPEAPTFPLQFKVPVPQVADRPRGVNGLEFTPDGKAFATAGEDGRIYLWDLRGNEAVKRYGVVGHAISASWLTFAPDGDTLLTAGRDAVAKNGGRVVLWKAADGSKVREWRLPDLATDGSFDATGRYVALGCADGKVYVLRLGAAPAGP
jgi:WD40 repeat protein